VSGWRRAVTFLPAAAFLATFGVFFVDKSREARTVLDSRRGLTTIAVIVLGYVAVAFAVRRVSRWAWLPPVVLAGVVLGLAAWTVLPYYDDTTVNRQLVSGPIRESPESTDERPPASTAGTSPSSTTTAEAAGATRIASGALQGIDHDAAGTVSLLRSGDGSLTVRFETFDLEGTPDPQLYLLPSADGRQPGGVALGRMPGNEGDVLDVAVPADAAAGASDWTLLVWCGRFAVPIANATLTS